LLPEGTGCAVVIGFLPITFEVIGCDIMPLSPAVGSLST
jgi:hypothetical protein